MDLKTYLNENDRFARLAGVALIEVGDGLAVARMTVGPQHLNAGGVCQGGALFTLADLAFAAAVNGHGQLTVSVSSDIAFFQSAREGDVLTAEARETVNHHKIPYCEVKVTNQEGQLVCAFTGVAYRKKATLPLSE